MFEVPSRGGPAPAPAAAAAAAAAAAFSQKSPHETTVQHDGDILKFDSKYPTNSRNHTTMGNFDIRICTTNISGISTNSVNTVTCVNENKSNKLSLSSSLYTNAYQTHPSSSYNQQCIRHSKDLSFNNMNMFNYPRDIESTVGLSVREHSQSPLPTSRYHSFDNPIDSPKFLNTLHTSRLLEGYGQISSSSSPPPLSSTSTSTSLPNGSIQHDSSPSTSSNFYAVAACAAAAAVVAAAVASWSGTSSPKTSNKSQQYFTSSNSHQSSP
uniref:Uncharacterized protein n=1 Tax=Schistosoma haematobium TaxID=6185 RepID=A0A094ZUQ2_SCHHA